MLTQKEAEKDKRSIGQPVVPSRGSDHHSCPHHCFNLSCEEKGEEKASGGRGQLEEEGGVVRPKWIVCLAHFGGKGGLQLGDGRMKGGGAFAIANPFLIPFPEVVD